MKTIDFRGFRFGKTHTTDLHLEVVSVSDRYEERILPSAQDSTAEIPGSDGQYYFGSTYKNREFQCSLAFDNITEKDYRKIRQIFATDKLQDLVFDEEPYKTWRAKVKSKPDFKSLCFIDKETKMRIYKGEGKVNFICYYPYAFGFNKYIIRAADYYTLETPDCIINKKESNGHFINEQEGFSESLADIRYQYNVNPSNYLPSLKSEVSDLKLLLRDKAHQNKQDRAWLPENGIWEGGFPTYEQAEKGELYFDTPDGEKTIIDVRGYWDNIPEWQTTAQLLTTPTLDFDQQLIYLPQYSKTDFVNMEMGFDGHRPIIGSRLLVYNPGDLSVDWELKINENKRAFWSTRGGEKFRISRYNVERLSIENAVDWCGMRTYKIEDDDYFKYGNKYFVRRGIMIQQLIDYISNINNYAELPKICRSYEERQRSEKERKYYNKNELLEKLSNGIIPFDKSWQENDDTPYSLLKDNRIVASTIYTGGQKVFTPAQTAFNLHIEDIWGKIFGEDYSTTISLGAAHPEYCYYVEPIPKEKLGHFIKLFYWQTIQWRGERLPNGDWIATDRYKEMIKDCIDEDGNIIDEDNPLIQMAKMFADVIVNEKTGSKKLITHNDNLYRDIYSNLNFENGISFANRYEELYKSCVTDEERYELYWDSLKRLLTEFYPIIALTQRQQVESGTEVLAVETPMQMINDFIYSYINLPQEYIGMDLRDLDYDNYVFNGYKMPQWITQDYLEIDSSLLSGVDVIKRFLNELGEEEDYIFVGNRRKYTIEDREKLLKYKKNISLVKTLDETIGIDGFLNDLLDEYYYLNTDKRMLYTTSNPYGMEFTYKPNKVIMNNAIIKGRWFKLPPGWSLICIEPLVDESLWGGKRWEDSRPYDWGYGGDINRNKREVQQLYDYVYKLAQNEFFSIYPKELIKNTILPAINVESNDENELTRFKMWYEDKIAFHKTYNGGRNYFAQGLYSKYRNDGEYQFLKIINGIWSVISPYFSWSAEKGVFIDPDSDPTQISIDLDDYDVTGLPRRCINADISDWWWYACNYLWANFPPLYWSMADILNKISIKYTPLFY